jgi:hypothetical protein
VLLVVVTRFRSSRAIFSLCELAFFLRKNAASFTGFGVLQLQNRLAAEGRMCLFTRSFNPESLDLPQNRLIGGLATQGPVSCAYDQA